MTRRRFVFWIGFGLFTLAERLNAEGLDKLAAKAMCAVDAPLPKQPAQPADRSSTAEHWAAGEDKEWRWYERENRIDGEWRLTGTTVPINKETGERKDGKDVYLDDSLLPAELRVTGEAVDAKPPAREDEEIDPHLPTAKCRSRHGRPPSEWLRSLHADEIRIWLDTIHVPEADVSGMTFWEHLTRDHLFDANMIDGLTIDEQAKLHAAAHFGY